MKEIIFLIFILCGTNITAQLSTIDNKIKDFDFKGLRFGLSEKDFIEMYPDAEIITQHYDIVEYRELFSKQCMINCKFENEKFLEASILLLASGDEFDGLINTLVNYFDGYKGQNMKLEDIYGINWFSTDSIRQVVLTYKEEKDAVIIFMKEIKRGLYLMREKFEINKFEISVENIFFKKNIKNTFLNETAEGIFACIEIEITNLANKNQMLDELKILFILLINSIQYTYEPSFNPTYIMNSEPKRFLLGLTQIPPLIPIKTTIVFEIPSEKHIMFLTFGDRKLKEGWRSVRLRNN